MEILTLPEAIVTKKITTTEAAKPVFSVVESFKPPFTPQEELATKFAGSGDPVGSHLPNNGVDVRPYSERRLEELSKVYEGYLLRPYKK